jgi:L-ascorbate metabolism protein UlaG (beta-lactamase superfamily)
MLRGEEVTLVTDPFAPSLGWGLPPLKAHIVTSSHPHPHHRWLQGCPGAKALLGPGEYEVKGIYVRGYATPLSAAAGNGGRNTVFVMEMEGLVVAHLGDLGAIPSNRLIEEIGGVHILMVPVGGMCTITPKEAVETARLVGARLTLPMHYALPGVAVPLHPLDPFLKEAGVTASTPQPRLVVSRSTLPEDPQVVVLTPRANPADLRMASPP